MSHHPKPGKKPSRWQLKQMAMDGVASTWDGCRVDLYGTCPHGHLSWLAVNEVRPLTPEILQRAAELVDQRIEVADALAPPSPNTREP